MSAATVFRKTRSGAAVVEHLPVEDLAARLEHLCKGRTAADAEDCDGEQIGGVLKDEDTGRWIWWSV